MKANIIILAIFLVFSTTLFSQKEGEIVILKTNIQPQETISLIKGEKLIELNFLEVGTKFRVVEIGEQEVKIAPINYQILKAEEIEDRKKNDPGFIPKSELYNDRVFIIKRQDYNSKIEVLEPKEKLSIGLLTLPFKARPQDEFSYDTEFNLNSTLNYAFISRGKLTFNVQIGAGIGTVGLNTTNAKSLESDEAQDVSTLTFLTGGMVQYAKVQFGAYVGVDQINNQQNYGWDSNGKLWFGFGIGYDLFNVTLAEGKSKQKN